MVKWFSALILSVLALSFSSYAKEKLHIAVAANFSAPVKTLAQLFELQCECSVLVTSGSTGMLFAQIVNGAPYDIFLAANSQHPLQLQQQQLIVEGSRFTYAVGQLVWWQPQGGADVSEVSKVNEASVRQWQQPLALANPKLAPYGVAAAKTLAHFGDSPVTKVKRIQGNNAAQTYQFIHSGNVAAGFVAVSQVLERPREEYWLVPPALYVEPIEQQLVILKASNNILLAQQFSDILRSPQGEEIIRAAGYTFAASQNQQVP
ncbi:molybdate ABC transporter substrate-binding protein [Alteromonadaceae bacterium BrNp21-10]|nr:molybdate ABC transporter substrate-binding protein [Alteromonadaceae bacterium BrNp21-10]